MLTDAGSLPDGTTLEADLCIIGSGAAGITLAREFIGLPHRVLLLESGPFDFDADANDLNAGRSVGRPYLDLAVCRQRFHGGTTNHWGGWCLPQEPIDFERGWPFPKSELDPYYTRAQDVCQLGPYDYRLRSWGVHSTDVPLPFRGPHFVAKMLQNSPPTRFRDVYGPELRRAERVSVLLSATVTRIVTGPGDARVESLRVAAPGGKTFSVRAGRYVLATGGVENARLLLLSGAQGRGGLGNGGGQLGRNFMVHLNTPGGVIALADPYTDLSFYTNVTSNGRDYDRFGHRFVSFIGLSEASMRALDLPNMRMLWDANYGKGIDTIRAFKRAIRWGDDRRGADIRAIMEDLGGASDYLLRHFFAPAELPVESLELTFTFEPTPYPESRIRLGDEVDALGMRRVEADWHIHPDDFGRVRRAVRLLGAEVGRVGFGRLRSLFEGEEWPKEMYGDQHHMGTTRMHADPAQGVVDLECRVHGVENLWVAGSSVFPRAGMSNPTLTITALALRLAGRLREEFA